MTVSVVTVTFNAAATVAEAVESVVSQRGDFTLDYHIVDGASTDGTLDKLTHFEDRIAQLTSAPDSGLYDAMNRGVARAKGDIIGILNADDAYAHDGVLAAVAAHLVETGADALYGDLDYVAEDESGRVVRRWRSGAMGPRSFLRGWMPPHPTFFLARSVYAEHGVYSLDLRSAADYELMLRMLHKHRVRTAYLPDVLVKMQTGGMSNASWGNRLRANREDRAAWRMNGLRPMPWTLVMKPLRKLGQWMG